MELQERLKYSYSLIEQYKIPIFIGALGVICILYGAYQYLVPVNQEISFESAATMQAGSASDSATENITVDVEGGVAHPGVYTLTSSARVKDAIIKAGGLSQSADQGWVAKNMNLAKTLTDASKLYIPLQNETFLAQIPVSDAILSENVGININSAGESELDTLEGVGPVTAQKIIQARPYKNIQDLVSKKIVSSKVFEKIKDKISAE